MASNRPVQLTRDSALVKDFYSAISGVPAIESILGPVIRNEVRSEGVIPRIRQAALAVMDGAGRDGVEYSLAARGGAVQILRRVGYGSGQGRKVEPGASKKNLTMTAYPSKEQKERFTKAAKDEGLSVAAWLLQIAEEAAAEAGYPPTEEEEEN